MKRKEIELHRSPNGKDIRKYGEQYVEYFYSPHSAIIRSNHILIEEIPNNSIMKTEIVNSEIILSNFLNLGKELYNKYIHKDIYNLNYLFERKMFNGWSAKSFYEFLELEIWKHTNIETDVIEWVNKNPFYGEFESDNNILYGSPIIFKDFVILSVTSYMIYRLSKISYNKFIYNESTNELCLLSVFSDIIKGTTNDKKIYLDRIKNIKAAEINKNCILILRQLFYIYPPKFSSIILNDGHYIKVYKSLLSMVIESLYSTICLQSNTIKMCTKCGNFYSGHGNSNLCIPCRKWKDNHKHIKNDRN